MDGFGDLRFFPIARRSLLKGFAGTILAGGIMPALLAQSSTPADRYLWIKGILSANRSLPGLTRIFLNAPVRFIEFPTRPAVFASAGYTPTQHIDVFVPISSNLYFSDDPAPKLPDISVVSTTPAFLPQHLQGRLLNDGSPATVIGKQSGVPAGISGRLKNGSNVSIQLAVSTPKFAAGPSMPQLTWVLCQALVAQDSAPPITVTFGFSPAGVAAVMGLSYGNVQTSVLAQFSPILDNAPTFILRRSARYYGLPFSQQTINSAVQSPAFAMPLAGSAIGPEVSRISLFGPVLASIAPPMPPPPLSSIAALAIGLNENRAGYVQRVVPGLATLLPSLASSMSDSSRPALPALARWMGSAIAANAPALQAAAGAAYDSFQALRNSNSPGYNWHRLPTMKDNDSDELSDQILDWAREHKG